jgi:DNA repair protein RadC
MLLKSKSTPLAISDTLLILEDIANQKQEHFVVLTLDSGGRLINKRLVFLGTVSKTMCHPREIFAGAIVDFASTIIVSHNHPSGDSRPSTQDIATTEQLAAAGQLLGIRLQNHVIVAGKEHFSFRANGLIFPKG